MLPGFTDQLKAVYDVSVRTRPITPHTLEVEWLATLAPQDYTPKPQTVSPVRSPSKEHDMAPR